MKKQKKGISLIVLIITIVVIIILATAVILIMTNNNPIENARKAVFQNDLQAIQEKVNTYYQSKYVESEGEYESESFTGDSMVAKFPNTEKYKDKIEIIKGEVILTNKATEEEILWAEEIGILAINKWDGSIDTAWYYDNPGANSFEIYTASELAGLAEIVNKNIDSFQGKTINLKEDIDLNNIEWTPIGVDIDDSNVFFRGKFDGEKHIVSNMKITEKKGKDIPSALFGCIWQISGYNDEVYVKNIIVKDSRIVGKDAGCIVGSLWNDNHSNDLCYVENCASINNYIEGSYSAGGVVNNLLDAKVINCYNTSDIVCTYNSIVNISSTDGMAGGIEAGCIDEGKIINCYNTGDITAYGCYAGGIVGGCSIYTIFNCYNVGNITGMENYTGEIIGYAQGSEIRNCYYLNGKIDIGTKDVFDPSYGEICETIAITESDLKLEDAINKLNRNGYSEYKQDTDNINSGYPILNWQ